MTKADIVTEVSNKTGLEKVTVQKTVEAFMEIVKKYSKRLKIRSASQPVIGIKLKMDDDRIKLLKNILEDLKDLLYNE